MPFVASTLETQLKAIFTAMNNMTEGGDNYLATNMALAIKTFVLTGVASTVDVGTVSIVNAYAGAGTGTMNIDNTTLANSLLSAFNAQKNNPNDDALATDIADSIHEVATKKDTIITSTVGTLTNPSGVVTPYAGTGKGTFSGSSAPLAQLLKSTFASMKDLSEGGNDIFALQMSLGVLQYFRLGVVSVVLDTPITGTGTGVIA